MKKKIKGSVEKPKPKVKPWPTCSKCIKPSVYMRRMPQKNGDALEEHYCVPHWADRTPRDLPPATPKKKPLKKKVSA